MITTIPQIAPKPRDEREARIRDLLPQQEEMLGKAYDTRLVRRLAHYAAPHRNRLLLAVILMITRSLLGVASPWIIGQAIDLGIRAGDLPTLRLWTFALIAVAFGEWITNRSRI